MKLGIAAVMNKALTVTSNDGQTHALEFTETSLTINQAGTCAPHSNMQALLTCQTVTVREETRCSSPIASSHRCIFQRRWHPRS